MDHYSYTCYSYALYINLLYFLSACVYPIYNRDAKNEHEKDLRKVETDAENNKQAKKSEEETARINHAKTAEEETKRLSVKEAIKKHEAEIMKVNKAFDLKIEKQKTIRIKAEQERMRVEKEVAIERQEAMNTLAIAKQKEFDEAEIAKKKAIAADKHAKQLKMKEADTISKRELEQEKTKQMKIESGNLEYKLKEKEEETKVIQAEERRRETEAKERTKQEQERTTQAKERTAQLAHCITILQMTGKRGDNDTDTDRLIQLMLGDNQPRNKKVGPRTAPKPLKNVVNT